jgi:tRNA A37 methylthiotransferase MiaB
MPDQIPSHEILRRAALLRELSETRHLAFARSFLGKTLRVLWERTVDAEGHRHGHADNFLEVLTPDTPSGPIRWNAMTPVTVTRAHDNGKVAATFSGISQ